MPVRLTHPGGFIARKAWPRLMAGPFFGALVSRSYRFSVTRQRNAFLLMPKRWRFVPNSHAQPLIWVRNDYVGYTLVPITG